MLSRPSTVSEAVFDGHIGQLQAWVLQGQVLLKSGACIALGEVPLRVGITRPGNIMTAAYSAEIEIHGTLCDYWSVRGAYLYRDLFVCSDNLVNINCLPCIGRDLQPLCFPSTTTVAVFNGHIRRLRTGILQS